MVVDVSEMLMSEIADQSLEFTQDNGKNIGRSVVGNTLLMAERSDEQMV